MLSERIKANQAKLQEKISDWESVAKTIEDEDRYYSEDEQTKVDELKADIDALTKTIEDQKSREQVIASQAKAVESKPVQRIETKDLANADKSLFFAKQAHCLFMTGGNRWAASDYAKHELRDDLMAKVLRLPPSVVAKAASVPVRKAAVDPAQTGTSGWAAELVEVNQAAEAFIELLRPMSVVARFPGRQMNFGGAGSIQIPRQTVGSSGTWTGENTAIKVDRMTLDQVTLTPKKNANIITATNEMLARSNPSALALIRDDIVAGVATAIDAKFVSADAVSAGVSPAGLQTFDGTPTSSGGGTLAQILADLKTLTNAMLSVNMPMVSPVWLMNPVNVNALTYITDGLGVPAFSELSNGTLRGYPVLTSTTVASDIVMLVDANQIIIATEMAPEIDLSGDATLHMDDTDPNEDLGQDQLTLGAPVASMFQLDSTAIRCKTTLDWGARYDECVQVLDTVAW